MVLPAAQAPPEAQPELAGQELSESTKFLPTVEMVVAVEPGVAAATVVMVAAVLGDLRMAC